MVPGFAQMQWNWSISVLLDPHTLRTRDPSNWIHPPPLTYTRNHWTMKKEEFADFDPIGGIDWSRGVHWCLWEGPRTLQSKVTTKMVFGAWRAWKNLFQESETTTVFLGSFPIRFQSLKIFWQLLLFFPDLPKNLYLGPHASLLGNPYPQSSMKWAYNPTSQGHIPPPSKFGHLNN